MKRALFLTFVTACFIAGVVIAGKQYREQSGIQLQPEQTPLTIERIDGTELVVYPILLKTVDSEWTAALLAVEPKVLAKAHDWYTAYRDSADKVNGE